MAVYKVIQDVESEDKLLGPLTFKSFIYAIIAGICAFINFKLFLIGTPLKYLFILMFLMPMILFGVLASPLGKDQPTEVWLLSKLRFFLKPRNRIWNQDGIEELVTITAPKRIEQQLAKDITQTEVQSRLKALASTLDTRGWVIKNVDLNLNVPTPEDTKAPESDRLVENAGYTQTAPVVDIHAADDIMDEQNNPTAQKFASLMKKADEDRKHSILSTIKDLIDNDEAKPAEKKPAEHHEMAKDSQTVKEAVSKYKKETAAERARRRAEEDEVIARKLAKARTKFSGEFESGHKKPSVHHQIVGSIKPKHVRAQAAQAAPVTPKPQAVNMELAQSGSAFSVATLSQLANRQPKVEQTGPDEVTISLH